MSDGMTDHRSGHDHYRAAAGGLNMTAPVTPAPDIVAVANARLSDLGTVAQGHRAQAQYHTDQLKLIADEEARIRETLRIWDPSWTPGAAATNVATPTPGAGRRPVRGRPVGSGRGVTKPGSMKARIVDAILAGHNTTAAIATAVGIGSKQLYNAVSTLKGEGKIVPGAKRGTYEIAPSVVVRA